MPIAVSELLFCLSGGPANADPDASLGGTMSTTTISSGVINNLFDDVSAAEAAAGDQEFRGIFLYNTNSSLTLSNARVWISASSTAPGDEVYIATDTCGQQSASEQTMSTIADESTEPTAIEGWIAYEATLSLGSIYPTSSYPLWIQRSVSTGAASEANDTFTIAWDGETA
jgi:hypothetical protein